METGSEGENNRNTNDNNNNAQSDGFKKPKRQMKTPFQLEMLEKTYASEMYPSEATRAQLSESLGLTDRQLQMWFCHRRLKDKKEGTVKKPVGEQNEALKSSKQELIVADRGGVGGSDHGSRSGLGLGSGSGSESDSSQSSEPVVHSRAYELTQQKMMVRRIIDCVEAQLGEALREDGPALGIEFDELPPGAFGTPIAVVKKPHGQTTSRSYEGNLFEQPDPLPIQDDVVGQEAGAVSRLYDSPVGYPSDQGLLHQNGQLPPPHAGQRQLNGSLSMQKGEMGHLSSPINDSDFIEPNEEVMQMWRKRKSEDFGKDGQFEKRMKKELEKKDLLRKKKEEQMRKEMEKQDRERRKEEERMMRERQRQEERFQREERRENERREKFLQKESLKAERRRQKEELRREKEAIKVKAAIEKAAARKIAKESMELIEDERLELLELAASHKGLTSIVSLDFETLQNLDSFRDLLCEFPPKSVQMRLKRPFSVHPWIDSEENVGNLLMVWRFCMTFADILGLWPFTLDEFVQALHDYESRLLGEVHIALLKLIVRDIEGVARTPSGGPGTNQYTVANPEGCHPQIVEGAYMWGFDIRNWLKHLNPLTWPEILRQFALSAGFGPQLKNDKAKHSCLPENDENKGCEDVITMLRNGSAAENAATLMQGKGSNNQKKSRHRMTPGTVKFAAYHVLCLEGSKGLNVLELAEKIQKTGIRDLTTSKTPDASISVALSRDPILFERIAPSTYCVRPAYRKDPATADEVISLAKEKIRTYTNGILSGVTVEDVEKDEDYESEVVEGQEIDDFGTSSTIKGTNFYNEDVKTSVCEDVDDELKTKFGNAGVSMGDINQESSEIDERKSEPWVQGLTEGEYSDLCVEDRLNALVALVGIANEGNIIRLVLEERLDAATSVRKQMWSEAKHDKRRMKEEFITKFQDSSLMVSTEGCQSPLIPVIDNKTNDGSLQTGHDSSVGQSVGQFHNNGYNTAERSQLQLRAFIGHKAEEVYVYRSIPLGQDRRRNRYWQFIASNSRHDPGSGRIYVELQNGCWRLIDSVEAFDALLLSLDTRGVRESHLHIMLQKIEIMFKENVRRKSNSMTCVSSSGSSESSPSFNIVLGRDEMEKRKALKRYQDLEKWMWKECLYSLNLSAKAHGKQRCTPLQGICDSCHASYYLEKAICPRCFRLLNTFGDKLCYLESDVQDDTHKANDPNNWDLTLPIRLRLIKSLLAFMEASVPSEALQSSWTENDRDIWGSKLHASLSSVDLLQVLTCLENVIKRDYMSLEFETTEELLGTSGLSELVSLGSVPVLPWIPQTTAAVSLRLLELDSSISYTPEQKVELNMGHESTDIAVEDEKSLIEIENALKEAINEGVVLRKPGFVGGKNKTERMFELMDGFLNNDPISLQKDILHHVEYTVARSRFSFDDFEAYQALSHSVRDRLIERWHDTQQHFKKKDPKRLYFLSLEFLMGRSLSNSVINLGIRDQCAEALSQLGFEYEVLAEQEGDAALGNGGLARLSACQMDSLATLDYPAWGYGLRYQYGLFRQIILDGFQYEQPDYWLNFGNPWEIERVHVSYSVKFYGTVEEGVVNGKKCKVWIPGETVEAVAYDNPIPGYGTRNTINLRLWAAKPSDGFDIESYNTGDYINAIVNRQKSEIISNVLYPDDRSYQGKELRLKQQYFFVSASLQDIIRRFRDTHGNFDEFPDKVVLQLNDTHPSISIAELMRVLLDEEHLGWTKSWNIVKQVFSFTTHTVLPEALEKVPVDLFEHVLPRHLQIIYDINLAFIEELKKKIGQDYARLSRMSIVEEGAVKNIRVANLSIVCSHTVNGVSKAHYELLKTRVFKDFYELWPEKFQYKTNGVTQRRWIVVSNPSLCALISKWLGTESWVRDIDLLARLREYASNSDLQKEWMMVKKINKLRLAEYIETMSGVKVSLDAMFDVQIKRIHEYKRQLLNILGVIHRYDCIKNMEKNDRKNVVPRVCIIGGKAPPGYEIAKKIIKLCHAVAETINNDDDVGDLLKLVFVPDYNVSVAELVIPGSDLSQHISTAGHEASGTGSMKFLMNGCLLLATADGSTNEIIEEIGPENMFIFGAKINEVPALREKDSTIEPPLQFVRVVRMVRDGYFGFKDYFKSLCDTVENGKDFYLLGSDFSSYLEAQAAADRAYVDKKKWTEMSILCTAGSARFSSDRTIEDYAEKTWGIQPCKCPF